MRHGLGIVTKGDAVSFMRTVVLSMNAENNGCRSPGP